MNVLSNFSSVMCVCSVAVSMLSMLVPQKRMKKTLHFILGLFLVCSLVIPAQGLFSSLSADFDFDEGDYAYDSFDESAYTASVLKETASGLVRAADNILASEGISPVDIRFSLKTDEKGCIYISRLIIYITEEDEDRLDEIAELMYRNFSKKAEIIIVED